MRDHHTHTEADAGRFEQNRAYPASDERDWDEGDVTIDRGHECDLAPFPDDCMGCLVWERYWAKERAAVDKANDEEWGAE